MSRASIGRRASAPVFLALFLLSAAPLAADSAGSGAQAEYAASVVYAAAPSREGADHWLRIYALESPAGLRFRDYEPAALGIAVNALSFDARESHRYDFRIYGNALYILGFDRSGSPTTPSGYWVNEGDKVLVFEIGPDLGLSKRAELPLMTAGRRTRTDEQFYQSLAFLEKGVWFTQWSVMTRGVKVVKGWTVGSNPLAPAERVFKDEAAQPQSGSFDSGEFRRPYQLMALLHATGGDIEAAEAAQSKFDRRFSKETDIRPYGSVIKVGKQLFDPRMDRVSKLPTDQAGSFVYSYNDNWIRPDRAYAQAGGRDWLVALRDSRLVSYDLADPAAPVEKASLAIGWGWEGSRLLGLSDGLAVANRRGYLLRVRLGPGGVMAAAWTAEDLVAAMARGDAGAAGAFALAKVDPRATLADGSSLFKAALERKASPAALEAYLDAALEVFGPGERYGGFDARSAFYAAAKAGDREAAAALLARFPKAVSGSDAVELAKAGDAAGLGFLLDLAPRLLEEGQSDAFGPCGLLYYAADEATRKLLVSLGAAESTRLEEPFAVFCSDQDVRIRAAPSTGAAILGKAGYGDEFLMIGRSNLRFESGGTASTWIELRLPSGQTGWSFGGYYSRSRPPR